MARSSENPRSPRDQAAPGADRNDWYGRWIDDIADDVADSMQGEEERQARIDDLHHRLDHLHRSLTQLKGRQRGRGPRVQAAATESGGEDARLRAEAARRLTDDWYVDATDIEIAVANGEVTLSGLIDNRAAKCLAEDCVDSIPGIRDVHNTLRIRQSR